jgi:hypothetical protein
MFSPVFEMLTYKVYNFEVPREMVPSRPTDHLFPMEERVSFKILSYSAPESFSREIFNKYTEIFRGQCDRLRGAGEYPKHFIYRQLYKNAIDAFSSMTQWRNLFENHYKVGLTILQRRRPDKCFEKTYTIIETFIALAEEYLLDHIYLVFHLPAHAITIFAEKYPEVMYEATIKKSRLYWIDQATSNIACMPYLTCLQNEDTQRILSFVRIFPIEICLLIKKFLPVPVAPSKPFVEYFNERYDYHREVINFDSHLFKLIKRHRIPNARTLTTFIDTISIQVYDNYL